MNTWIIRLGLISASFLLVIGCQETTEQPPLTQLKVSITNTSDFDSAFVSIIQAGDTLWQNPIYQSEGHYSAVINLNPGSYSLRAGGYLGGMLCYYTSYALTFTLSQGEQKYLPVNLNPQLPLRPDSLWHSGVTSTSVTLNWLHNGQLLSGFIIARKLESDTLAEVDSIAAVPASWRSYLSTGLSNHTAYIYQVGSYNPAGRPSQYSGLWSDPDTVETTWGQ